MSTAEFWRTMCDALLHTCTRNSSHNVFLVLFITKNVLHAKALTKIVAEETARQQLTALRRTYVPLAVRRGESVGLRCMGAESIGSGTQRRAEGRVLPEIRCPSLRTKVSGCDQAPVGIR